MIVQVQILVIILSLISGMIAIFLANRIMQKYPLPFLSSYFNFLVFIYIFSVYSLIGSQSISKILLNNDIPRESARSVEAMLIALGIPFLVLAIYMFLRLSREFFKLKLNRYFVALYFFLFALSFAGYAMLNIDVVGFDTITFHLDRQQIIWTFSGIMILVFGYALLFILAKTRSVRDVNQRIAYRWFTLWYVVIVLVSLISLHLASVHFLFSMIFIVVFTGFHLLPVVFLGYYLQRFYVEKTEDSGFPEKLRQLVVQYEISKREAEIIELICKGMSNQEISDSLFISLQTVKDHVHRIFTKTGVKNRVQLANLPDAMNN